MSSPRAVLSVLAMLRITGVSITEKEYRLNDKDASPQVMERPSRSRGMELMVMRSGTVWVCMPCTVMLPPNPVHGVSNSRSHWGNT